MSSVIRLGEVAKPSRIYLKGSIVGKKINVLFDKTEYSTTGNILISAGKPTYSGAELLPVTVEIKARAKCTGTSATITINLYDKDDNITTITADTTSTSYTLLKREMGINGFNAWEIYLSSYSSTYTAYAKNLEINVIPQTDGITIFTDDVEKSTTSTTYVTVASGTPNYPIVQNFKVYVSFRFKIKSSSTSGAAYAKVSVTDMNNVTYSYETYTYSTSYVYRSTSFLLDGFKSWQIQIKNSSSSYTTYLNNIKINYAYVYYANSLTPKDLNASIMFLKQLTIGPGDYLYIDDDNVRKIYINSTGLEMIIELDPPLPVNKINFPKLDANIVGDFLVIE